MSITRELDGDAGTTQSIASTNTAQGLATTMLTDTNLGKANGAIITIEDNSIRYAFNATPTQAGLGHIATANSVIILNSPQMVYNFKFISHANNTHAVMQVTPVI
jgi:hypothetical protein